MSTSVFIHATAVEAVIALVLLGARMSWRRYGPRRALTGVTLVLVLWELSELVRHWHVTPRAQALAFLAISVYLTGVLVDDRARTQLVPRWRIGRRR